MGRSPADPNDKDAMVEWAATPFTAFRSIVGVESTSVGSSFRSPLL